MNSLAFVTTNPKKVQTLQAALESQGLNWRVEPVGLDLVEPQCMSVHIVPY